MSLALDALTANVTGAWGLRRMLTAWGGNAGILKRLADSITSDISFLGDALDRRQATSFHNLTFVNTVWTTFYDQSGNGHNAVGPTDEVVAFSAQYQAGAFVGDSLGAILQNSSSMAVNAGAPVHTTLHAAGVGTVLAVVQSFGSAATQNIFGDNGGWFGLQFYNAGGVGGHDFTAKSWHYNSIGGGTYAESGAVNLHRYQTNIVAWRANGTSIDVCVNGVWSTATASAPTGGSGNILTFGSASLTGQFVEGVTLNVAATNDQIDAWGAEASTYWRGRWPVSGGGSGGVSRGRLVNAGAG